MPDVPRRVVRRAVPSDEPVLRRLQTALDEPAPSLLDAALSDVVGDLFVVAVDAPVGYLLAVDGPPSALDVSLDVERSTHVAELVVAPAARRNGHASALLGTLLSTYPTETLTLTVAVENTAARSLYDQFGFRPVRRLPDFFATGDGLLLARRPGTE